LSLLLAGWLVATIGFLAMTRLGVLWLGSAKTGRERM
jgi:hypothetical protein